MKLLIFILFQLSVLHSNGQKMKTCAMLDAILSYEPAKRPYYFDKNLTYSIIFYDTVDYFMDCSIDKYYERSVKVSHDSLEAESISPSNYIITVASQNKRIFKIRLNYRTSGAYCLFTLKWKKNKFKVTSFHEAYL